MEERASPAGRVRRVAADGVEAWCQAPLPGKAAGLDAWVRGERAWVERWHSSTRNLFVYERGGELLGKYDVPIEEGGCWTLWAPSVRPGPQAAAVMDALCVHVRSEARRRGVRGIEVILEASHGAFEVARAALQGAGFELAEERVVVRRDLTRPLPEPPAGLEVRPVSEFDAESYRDLGARVEAPPEQRTGETPPRWGLVAFLEGEPAGLALASSAPGDAVLTEHHIGLVAEARGRGYGWALLLYFLHLGRASGATTYVGSTRSDNVAMLRLFDRAGCTRIGKRLVYGVG